MQDQDFISKSSMQNRAAAGDVPAAVYPPVTPGRTPPLVPSPQSRQQNQYRPEKSSRWKFGALFRGHRMLAWMVVAAFAIRLAVLLCTYGDHMNPVMGYWFMGQEEAHVAQSIVEGHGFGNPLYTQTGPTAWFAPIYPYLLALDFRIFGTFTSASCLAILVFDSLVSSLTCLPIFFFARRGFGRGAALAAGWTWVVYPYAVWWPIYRIWDTWLATLLLATLFAFAVLKLEHSASLKHWIGFGALSGITALVDPSVLSVLPFLVLWALWRVYQRERKRTASSILFAKHLAGSSLLAGTNKITHRRAVGRVFAAGLACLGATILVISPWMIRNYEVFHKFIPIRDNLPLEFRVGNTGDSSEPLIITAGPWVPWIDNTEWNEYTTMGELAYFHWKGEQAKQYIEAHPLWYAGMCARRALYIWTGFWSFSHHYLSDRDADHEIDLLTVPLLGLLSALTFMALARAYRKKGASVAAPYAIVLFCFPLIYYFTHVGGWYRCPMGPMIIALAAYEVHTRAAERLHRRERASAFNRAALGEGDREQIPAVSVS